MDLELRFCKHPECRNDFRVLPNDKQEYCCRLCGIHDKDEEYLKNHTRKKNFLKLKNKEFYGKSN